VCGSYAHGTFFRNVGNTITCYDVLWEGGSGSCATPPSQQMYMQSADGGSTWSTPVSLGTNFYPGVITCSGSNVYVASNNITQASYQTQNVTSPGSTYNTEVYLYTSVNNGMSFLSSSYGPAFQISNAWGRSEDPAIATCGNNVYLAWNDERDNLTNIVWFQVYYRFSSNNGASWSSEIAMSHSPQREYGPTVWCSGSTVLIITNDFTSKTLVARLSHDGGQTFTPPPATSSMSQVVSNDGFYPLIVIDPSEQDVFVTFGSLQDSTKLWITSSNDGGTNWTPANVIVTAPTGSIVDPTCGFITLSGNAIHVLWRQLTAPAGHFALYYMNGTYVPTPAPSPLFSPASVGTVAGSSPSITVTAISITALTPTSITPTILSSSAQTEGVMSLMIALFSLA